MLQEPCRRVDVAAFLSVINVVYFAFGCVSYTVSGDASCSSLRRNAEMSEVQMNYICLVAQFRSLNAEQFTKQSSAQQCGDDSIDLRALLHTSEDGSNVLEGQTAAGQKGKEAIAFKRVPCDAKAGRFQIIRLAWLPCIDVLIRRECWVCWSARASIWTCR